MPTPNPAAEKAAFLATHVYSKAPEAGAKRRIDETLMGGDFAKRDTLMEPDATLGGSGGEIMLDAIAFEDRHAPVGAAHRQRDGEAAPGIFGPIADILLEVDGVGGLVELATGHPKHVGIIERGNNSFGHGTNRVLGRGVGGFWMRHCGWVPGV